MERPVRSFRSFIRAIPPRTISNKPPSPAPAEPTLQKNPSISSITTVQTRSTRLSLWEAPPSWDNDSAQDQVTPSSALRQYSPLIPEPPEDIAAMQADPILWQQGHGPFQQTPLDPIRERTAVTPEIPARNPSRLSRSISNPATIRENSRDTAQSVESKYSTGTLYDELLAEEVEPASIKSSDTGVPSPLDLVAALADRKLNHKAIESSKQEPPRDQDKIYGSQHSDSAELDDDAHLITGDNKLKMFRKGSTHREENTEQSEGLEISGKMEALIFAQDYHNVLSDQANDDANQSTHEALPVMSLNDRDLAPLPLTWRKDSVCPPASEAPQRPQLPPTTSSGRYKNLRMMSSWVNHRMRKDPRTGLNQRSVSDPAGTAHIQLPDAEEDRHVKNEPRLANIMQHGRAFIARKILRRQSEPARPLLIGPALLQQSAQMPTDAVASAAPYEIATPVLRLPGGLTVVRQSPCSTIRPHTANGIQTACASKPASSDITASITRRSSWQGTASQPHAAAAANSATPRKLSLPLPSPSRLRNFSRSTTSLPNLAAPNPNPTAPPLPSPYKPPQPRRRSHNIGSKLTAPPSTHSMDRFAPDTLEAVMHKLNVFEKAKQAHDVWKKHQKEVKTEKLKQSIRLVGPADARDVAGYIDCAIEGRLSKDSGIGEAQVLGSRVGNVN